MPSDDTSWNALLRRFLERRDGYAIIGTLLESPKEESEIVENVTGPQSSVHEWLTDASEAGIVEEDYRRVDGSVRTLWSIDSSNVPDEAIQVIKDRGKTWRTHNPTHSDIAGSNFSIYRDEHNIDSALGLNKEEE